MSLLQEVAQSIVGLLFVLAGVLKLFSFQQFRGSLYLFPYLGVVVAQIIAIILPLLEIAVGIGLILNYLPAKISSLILLSGFCILAFIVIRKGLKIPCNCFGAQSSETLSTKTILRNLLLITLVAFSWKLQNLSLPLLSLVTAATLISMTAAFSQIKITSYQVRNQT